MGDGRSALPALVFGEPTGSLGGSSRIEARPRAVSRKEKDGRRAQRITSVGVRRTYVGAKLGWRQRRARLVARSVVTPRRFGSCGSRARGPLSFSGFRSLGGGSRIEARPCAVKEGGRRATGAAHNQRWCSADLRDRSAAALELKRGLVRWRGRRKAGGGRSSLPALVFGGAA